MRIPEAQIAQVVDRLDIVDVVGEYTALRQRGNRYWGLCPFHTEKTPSFSVSADKAAFYCFGCGKGGGLIQFVMDVEQLPFPEAVRMLAERAGVQLEAEQRPAGAISRREYVELNSRIAETSITYCAPPAKPRRLAATWNNAASVHRRLWHSSWAGRPRLMAGC